MGADDEFSCNSSGLLCAALVLVGCTNAASPVTQKPALQGCGASLLQNKVGEPVTGTSASDTAVGAVPVKSKGDVRVIAPDEAVIQNYSESRLNLEVDDSGNLVRASCG
jgi:hypothetical protein